MSCLLSKSSNSFVQFPYVITNLLAIGECPKIWNLRRKKNKMNWGNQSLKVQAELRLGKFVGFVDLIWRILAEWIQLNVTSSKFQTICIPLEQSEWLRADSHFLKRRRHQWWEKHTYFFLKATTDQKMKGGKTRQNVGNTFTHAFFYCLLRWRWEKIQRVPNHIKIQSTLFCHFLLSSFDVKTRAINTKCAEMSGIYVNYSDLHRT